MNDSGCIKPNTPYNERILVDGQLRVKQTNCTWYRIRVDAVGGSVLGCRGRLISVKRGFSELLDGEYPPLPFTHSTDPDGSATVHEGVSEFLDLMAILYDQRVELAVPLNRRSGSISWRDMFSLSGSYEIKLAITAPNITTVPIELLFNWNLQPNTAKLEIKNQQKDASPLRITVGTSIDFYELAKDRLRLYSYLKRFKIRVDNTDLAKTISGIKVAVASVAPLDGNYRFPWILSENGSINPGDFASVPLALYEERSDPGKYPENPTVSDTFEIPALGDRTLLLGIENEHTFQLRCTANDVPPVDAKIKISVIAGRMQIEKI